MIFEPHELQRAARLQDAVLWRTTKKTMVETKKTMVETKKKVVGKSDSTSKLANPVGSAQAGVWPVSTCIESWKQPPAVPALFRAWPAICRAPPL